MFVISFGCMRYCQGDSFKWSFDLLSYYPLVSSTQPTVLIISPVFDDSMPRDLRSLPSKEEMCPS